MQRHGVHSHSVRGKAGQQPFGEMQSGGRRRDRPLLAREHRLIIGAVPRIGRAPSRDVGRQRHRAALGDRLVQHRPVERERECHLARLALGFNGRIELA